MEEFHIPHGFRAAAVKAGIKPSGGLDLAVFVADRPCSAAGTFTTNRIAAAPVQWDRALVPSSHIRAIVVNAGNANAATGQQGLDNARRTAEVAAQKLGCEPEEVLVASTGVIGHQLPMDRLEAGLQKALGQLSDDAGAFHEASLAIMTTDTRPKVVSLTEKIGGHPVRLIGIAKGAAMIGPRMATMLGFLMTDANVGRRRPGAIAFERGRGFVQLHLDRGPYQHERHGAGAVVPSPRVRASGRGGPGAVWQDPATGLPRPGGDDSR